MTVNRTTLLNLPLPVTGTESGTWGDTTNNGLTQYVDIAVAGMTSLTSTDFSAGNLTISNSTGNSTGTNIAASSAQYATIKVSSLAANSTITAPSSNRAYRVINADATYTLTVKASGQTGITFQPGQSGTVAYNGTDYGLVGTIGPTVPVNRGGTGLTSGTSGGIPYFSSSTAITSSGVLATNAFVLGGGAGGSPVSTTTGTGVVTAVGNNINTTGGLVSQSGTLAANALLLGGGSGTAITSTTTGTGVVTALGVNVGSSGAFTTNNATNTFTAAQTFRAANAVRSEAASTQDAVVLAGRAGGTSSYAATLTPTTLTGNVTLTLPDASGTVALTSNIPNAYSNAFGANLFGGFQ